jgi:hypothetical protein
MEPPEDARAAKLFERLDEKYFEFVNGLPSPLSKLALTKSTYVGQPGVEAFEGVTKMNAVIACTPWLFWELFCGLDDEEIMPIAEAGTYYALASVILDHLLDKQTLFPEASTLLHQALYERGTSGLRKIFPMSSPFWKHFDRLAKEHVIGMAVEIEAQNDPDVLTMDSFFMLAKGKIAPMVVTMAALTEASDQGELLQPIEDSIKTTIAAGQMHDDIGDWKDDLQNQHMTYFMSLLAPPPPDSWMGRDWPTEAEMQKRIDDSWEDINQLRIVVSWFDEARSMASELGCPAWENYVTNYREVADKHLTAFTTLHMVNSLQDIVDGDEGKHQP